MGNALGQHIGFADISSNEYFKLTADLFIPLCRSLWWVSGTDAGHFARIHSSCPGPWASDQLVSPQLHTQVQ